MTGGIIAGTMIAGDMTGGTIAVITVADATVRVARDTQSGINTTISEVKDACRNAGSLAPREA
jgi:hypothetical protein